MFAKREVRCTNPDCGTLNRVPRYSIRRIPKCGKCHTKLHEVEAVKILRDLYRLRAVLIAVPIVGVFAWAFWPTSKLGYDPLPKLDKQAATPTNKQPVPACVRRMLPTHGLYEEFDFSERPALLTIRTASGSAYLVSLENATTGYPTLRFFVYGGHTFEAKVPLGAYKIKYAAGSYWCGEVDLFGAETIFSEAEDIFTFNRSVEYTGDGYTTTTSHWVVELILQRGGNLKTKRITRDEFYGRGRR